MGRRIKQTKPIRCTWEHIDLNNNGEEASYSTDSPSTSNAIIANQSSMTTTKSRENGKRLDEKKPVQQKFSDFSIMSQLNKSSPKNLNNINNASLNGNIFENLKNINNFSNVFDFNSAQKVYENLLNELEQRELTALFPGGLNSSEAVANPFVVINPNPLLNLTKQEKNVSNNAKKKISNKLKHKTTIKSSTTVINNENGNKKLDIKRGKLFRIFFC